MLERPQSLWAHMCWVSVLAQWGNLGHFNSSYRDTWITTMRDDLTYTGIYLCEAKFWIRRFRDAWESCTHKKALTVAIFLLVWNLSSVVARIWAGKQTNPNYFLLLISNNTICILVGMFCSYNIQSHWGLFCSVYIGGGLPILSAEIGDGRVGGRRRRGS